MNAAIHAFRTDQDNVLLSPWLAHVERTPGAIAVSGAYGTVRYDGLHAAVCSFVAGLDRHGIGPDDIVAFAADHSPESIALMLAIAANGAAWLPLVPEAADPRLAELVAEARPQLVIGDAALRRRLAIDAPWIERGALISPQRQLDLKPCGTLAYVLFTLGRHGRTHGVAMRTRAAADLIGWQRRHARLGKPARTLQFAALDSETAFSEIFGTLGTGGCLILADAAERRDLSALLALLRRERIERAFLPAAVVEMLAAVIARRAAALPSSLLDVITGGAQLAFTPELRALVGALHDCVLHIHYGPSRGEAVIAQELSAQDELPPLTPPGMVQPHARAAAESTPKDDAGAWQHSAVAARAAALLRAARAAGTHAEPPERRHAS